MNKSSIFIQLTRLLPAAHPLATPSPALALPGWEVGRKPCTWGPSRVSWQSCSPLHKLAGAGSWLPELRPEKARPGEATVSAPLCRWGGGHLFSGLRPSHRLSVPMGQVTDGLALKLALRGKAFLMRARKLGRRQWGRQELPWGDCPYLG